MSQLLCLIVFPFRIVARLLNRVVLGRALPERGPLERTALLAPPRVVDAEVSAEDESDDAAPSDAPSESSRISMSPEAERRTLEIVEETFAALSKRLASELGRDITTEITARIGDEFQIKLEHQAAELDSAFSAKVERLDESIERNSRAAFGRIDLLHDEIERLRNVVETRLEKVENDVASLGKTVSGLHSATSQLGHRLKEQAQHVDAEFTRVRTSINDLAESVDERVHELAVQHQIDIDALRRSQTRAQAESRDSRTLLSDAFERFADQVGEMSHRMNRLTFEAEEILKVGRARPSLLGRIAHGLTLPFRVFRLHRKAITQSLEVQKLMVCELVQFKNQLRELCREYRPAESPRLDGDVVEVAARDSGVERDEEPPSRPRFDPALLEAKDHRIPERLTR